MQSCATVQCFDATSRILQGGVKFPVKFPVVHKYSHSTAIKVCAIHHSGIYYLIHHSGIYYLQILFTSHTDGINVHIVIV